MAERISDRIELIGSENSERLLNLSATGAAFVFPRELQKGDPVAVRINELTIEGNVVYCHTRVTQFRIGIRFLPLPFEMQAEINKMVDSFSCGVPLRFTIITSPLKQ